MGQVAMATDHGGRPTMPTGDAGSPISGRSSETREECGNSGSGPWGCHRIWLGIRVALVPVGRIWRGPVAATLGGLPCEYQ